MKINTIIKVLIIFSAIWTSGLGFITPIFAIFITRQIVGGNLEMAGFAVAIHSIGFCLARLPGAKWVDKKMNEVQRFYLLILSGVLVALSYFFYILISFSWQMYFLQALIGIGAAFNTAAFVSFFTRFIDKGEESFEWGLSGVASIGGQAIAAAIGGIIASRFGFNAVFILAGLFVLMSSSISIAIYKNFK